MDDLELLRGLGRDLEHDPPATLVRQRRRLLDAAESGGRAVGGVRRPSRGTLRWTVVGMVAVVTAALILVPAVFLDRGDVRPAATEERRPVKVNGALNVLLIGSDDRGRGGERADTIVLVHLPKDRKRVRAVSFPRDIVTQLPGCKGRSGKPLPARRGILGGVFTEGGLPCTVKTIETLTRVRVDQAVVVEFAGFKRMVDALDGVEVTLPKAVDDPKSGLRLPAGRHRVNGTQALAYVRVRHGLGDGSDLSRIVRQQRFMASMARRAKERRLRDPVGFAKFLVAAAGSVQAFPPMDAGALRKLADSLAETRIEELSFSMAPTYPSPDDPNRLAWDHGAAVKLFAQFKEGS